MLGAIVLEQDARSIEARAIAVRGECARAAGEVHSERPDARDCIAVAETARSLAATTQKWASRVGRNWPLPGADSLRLQAMADFSQAKIGCRKLIGRSLAG